MSLGAQTATVQAGIPAPRFEITHAAHLAFAASPTMVFEAVATEPAGHDIRSLALSVQVMIEPVKRGYNSDTRGRLVELFGPPARWGASTQGLQWGRVAVIVRGFRQSTTFAIELPCTYDLEVAAAKYLHALSDGEVPLGLHFSGQVFYRDAEGRLQVAPVPWSRTAQFRMPIAAWRAMIAEHYPGGGWIRLADDTLSTLNDRRAARGLPTFDACVKELLAEEAGDAR